MAIPSGLSAQLGIAAEETYGTYKTVDTFLEFVSESMSLEIERLESAGLRAGTNIQRSDRWVPGSKTVSGDLTLELHDRGQLLLWEHTLGLMVSEKTEGATSVYTHTFTPGTLPDSLSVQIGRPSSKGTVHPFTYTGCRVVSAGLSCAVGEIASLTLSLVGQDETTSQQLETASYPTSELLTFVGATLKLASSDVEVTDVELNIETGINPDRRKLGSRVIRQPIEAAMRVISGTLNGTFEDLTAYGRFVSGAEASLVLTFLGSNIEAGHDREIEITLNVRFDGETPQVGGPDELTQALPWKAVASSNAASAITVVITNDEVGNYTAP